MLTASIGHRRSAVCLVRQYRRLQLRRSTSSSKKNGSIIQLAKLHRAPATASALEPTSTNPQINFPCLDHLEHRTASLSEGATAALPQPRSQKPSSQGPEPSYSRFTPSSTSYNTYHHAKATLLDHGGVLPEYDVAYETWGALNGNKSNAILVHTGLSASSHARSHEGNAQPGWWEKFIGPGLAIDTDKFYVICTNVIGGCYGSTGPSSRDPGDGNPYATRFPIVTMWDMVRAQFTLLDYLGIRQLYASVGSSMGGMQSLAAGVLGGVDRVGRIVSISGCAKSHPYSIAMRHTQRQVLMADPHWNRGFYYDGVPPHHGMKLARELATITYRSGPEWEHRFGRKRADPSKPPAFCPDCKSHFSLFIAISDLEVLIETYLDHSGEKWCLQYDANSLLYVSKAMDLFDMSWSAQAALAANRTQNAQALNLNTSSFSTVPDVPYVEQDQQHQIDTSPSTTSHDDTADLANGFVSLRNHPVLVMGVASDILFPARQQQEVSECLRAVGNTQVKHVELSEEQSWYGHDSFLLLEGPIGNEIKQFLAK